MKSTIFNFLVLLLLSVVKGSLANNSPLTVNTTITYTLISVPPSSYHPESAKLAPSNHSLSRTLSYATTKVGFLPRKSQALITTRSTTRYSTTTVTVSPVPYAKPTPPSPFLNPRSSHLLYPAPCTPNTIFCNSATEFSVCAASAGSRSTHSLFVYIGPVAVGTVCRNNKVIRASATNGKCTPIGNLVCRPNRQVIFACTEGGVISMGKLSTLTRCVNGRIVAMAENENENFVEEGF